MKKMLPIVLFFFFVSLDQGLAEENELWLLSDPLPSHVQSIEQENTLALEVQPLKETEANSFTSKLLKSSDVQITNPYLIEQLNATNIKHSRFAFGYSSDIYLGRWPLHYQDEETSINWAYQKVNTNHLPDQSPEYYQLEDSYVNGGLQTKVERADQVQMMVLESVRARFDLPVDYQAGYGASTEKTIPMANQGVADTLEAYAGAIKEKGKVTYGEVYLSLTGRKAKMTIKNVVESEITAWLPIKDYLAFNLK
ncbi:YfkD family protein [Amphibacillus sediminis]|uniref:YfkD family protein n=1 Tax=Amphibacillus sediminis TaxID=360185 RepID=UPI00082E42C9|nr:YfkD family protein [Amphibacillus sediminis]